MNTYNYCIHTKHTKILQSNMCLRNKSLFHKHLSEACSPDGEETPEKGAEPYDIGAQLDSDHILGIRNVFRTFTEQLEKQFDVSTC